MAEGAELGGGDPGDRGEAGAVSGARLGSHLVVTEPDIIAAVFMSVIEWRAERGPGHMSRVRGGSPGVTSSPELLPVRLARPRLLAWVWPACAAQSRSDLEPSEFCTEDIELSIAENIAAWLLDNRCQTWRK